MCSTYNGKLDVSCYATKDMAKCRQELNRLVQVHLKAELELMHSEYYKFEKSPVILEIGQQQDNEQKICI